MPHEGNGTHNYTCAECGTILVKNMDHSRYRFGNGIVFKCGKCNALNEMPADIPTRDPKRKQIVIESGPMPS